MSGDTNSDATDLAFRARALAQTHPFSAAAYRIVNRIVADEASMQPLADAGIWAGAALTQGYCLRRVQEANSGIEERVAELASDDSLERDATQRIDEIRNGGADDQTIAALDLLVGSQVQNRVDQWGDSVDPVAFAELEHYLTWWVVKGYALRQAETVTSTARSCDC